MMFIIKSLAFILQEHNKYIYHIVHNKLQNAGMLFNSEGKEKKADRICKNKREEKGKRKGRVIIIAYRACKIPLL